MPSGRDELFKRTLKMIMKRKNCWNCKLSAIFELNVQSRIKKVLRKCVFGGHLYWEQFIMKQAKSLIYEQTENDHPKTIPRDSNSKNSGGGETETRFTIYSIIRLYWTRLYRNSAFIEVQSAVPPDTMSIQKMIGYIKTWIYRSVHRGPLNFDITRLYCTSFF